MTHTGSQQANRLSVPSLCTVRILAPLLRLLITTILWSLKFTICLLQNNRPYMKATCHTNHAMRLNRWRTAYMGLEPLGAFAENPLCSKAYEPGCCGRYERGHLGTRAAGEEGPPLGRPPVLRLRVSSRPFATLGSRLAPSSGRKLQGTVNVSISSSLP